MPDPFLDDAEFMRACGLSTHRLNSNQAALYRRLIDEEKKELDGAITEAEAADAVIDLIYVLIGYGFSRGWPMGALWAEVHRSNMAKVDPETGAVRRREDGKILKPEGWTPPDIAGALARHAEAAR